MTVLDHAGRPYVVPTKTDLEDDIAGPSLGSVRQIATGHPADGLTPHRLGNLLKEAEMGDATAYLEMAEQMEERDLHYGGVLAVRKRAIRKLTINVEAASTSDQDEKAAMLVREALDGPAVKDDLINMLDAIGKGYSATEIKWDTSSNPWTIADLKWRDPRWFKFDPTDGHELLLRDNDGDLPLPPGRFIIHKAVSKSGLPIRGGLARLVAWAFVFKHYTLKDWAVFMEAYGHPIRIGRYGTHATKAERSTLLRAVRSIGTDLAAIIPREMDLELVTTNVTGTVAMFEDNARYWDEQVSKAVLGQVSTTDAIAGGHAVGKVHAEVRDDIRDADADQLAVTLMRDVAGPITFFNVGPNAKPPKISFVAEEEQDKRMMMVAIKEFGPRGLEVSVQTVREIYGVREPEEGEELLKFDAPKAIASPEAPSDGKLPLVKEMASAQSLAQHGSAIGDLVEHLAASGAAQASMDPWLGGLLDAIDDANSFDEVRDLLAEIADSAPDSGIRELLTRLSYNARLAGELNAIS